MEIKIKRLVPEAKIPVYGTEFSAGADLFALKGDTVPPHKTVLFGTGISLEIPTGNVGLICARSGISVKRSLAPANKVGVIDSDYRGEIVVALHNHSDEEQTVADGERIAQILFTPYIKVDFSESETLDETERGNGGFGSTGR